MLTINISVDSLHLSRCVNSLDESQRLVVVAEIGFNRPVQPKGFPRTTKERDEFTVRCLMALVTALAVHNYKNARAGHLKKNPTSEAPRAADLEVPPT